ncbi:MAG TPA: A/G-specific adenine glycosylase, partial [Terriglobales bacterium]|nr:A/G-specific adenine glycosylase [Terriglobales bacterium]
MLRRALLAWYARRRRSLPWRGERDPYRVWVSEVMLQQTRVAVAVPYYRPFLERFPTLASLARASEAEVLAAWAGLGYYRRARSLHRA